jgi:hypothetical protein
MVGDFDLEVSGSSSTSNQQIQVEVAKEVLAMTSNPMDIQIGIVTPANRYEAIKNYLQAIGVKDFSRFINAKFESQQPQMTVEEEAGRVLRGYNVPVLPNSDHEGFIAYAEEIINSDELLGQFNEEQAKALEVQRRKHVQMKQALDQMAAQQANSSQMRINAANSQNQMPMAPVQGSDTGMVQ